MHTLFSSLLLSAFFSAFLLLGLHIRNKFDFDVIKTGKTLSLPRTAVILLLVAVGAICASFAYAAMAFSGPALLQMYYIILFFIAFCIGVFFLLPIQRLLHGLSISIGIALFLMWLSLALDIPWLGNVYMAASLLWIAPFVFSRWHVKQLHFIVFILVFTIIDIINIYFMDPSAIFSDADFALNAIVQFGEFELGIGDFLFAYLSIEAAARYAGTRPAAVLAVLLGLPRFLIRVLIPSAAGMVFPYAMFMAPIVLLVLWYCHNRKERATVSIHA